MANIWLALRTKLKEWGYEEEYRFQPNHTMVSQALEVKEKYIKIQYAPEFVDSIIFGCCMNKEVRDFIVKNIPYEVDVKEVIVEKSSLRIINYQAILTSS